MKETFRMQRVYPFSNLLSGCSVLVLLVLICLLPCQEASFVTTVSKSPHLARKSSFVSFSSSVDTINNDVEIEDIQIQEQALLSSTPTSTTSLTTKLPKRTRIKRKLLFWKNYTDVDNSINEDEDGYSDMRGDGKYKSMWFRTLRKITLNNPIMKLRKKKTTKPGTLILIRHGESLWNANKTFTGWADPDINDQGKREAEYAARLILESGYEIDVVFTSRLKRAIRSTWIILQELNEIHLPVFKFWRLNERMYGALTGLCKKETAEQLGHELVQAWRGSLKSRPPPLSESDKEYYPAYDRRYSDLSPQQIPRTESLEDCMMRTIPVWENKIKNELSNGQNVMVVAHANTLRGLVKTIDNIGDDEIQDIAIPTGIPIIYKFDNDLNVIRPDELIEDKQTASQIHMNGVFLEKPGLLKIAMTKEQEWCERVPGYNSTISRSSIRAMSPLERSLNKLVAERKLGDYAMQFQDPNSPDNEEDDGTDGKLTLVEDEVWEKGIRDLEEGDQFDPDGPVFHLDDTTNGQSLSSMISGDTNGDTAKTNNNLNINGYDGGYDDSSEVMVGGVPTLISNRPCVVGTVGTKSLMSSTVVPGSSSSSKNTNEQRSKDSNLIVIIRHGKTENNKLGLFTGWDDVPLAKEGISEAIEAGKLLKAHGFEFDVVYTSWLSRAIETAWYVMDELDCLWLPIIKSWRLNERMYGELTGLSKRMVKQRHGDKQFKAWRRGYKVKPPPVSSFSPKYPGNDKRYERYLNDARYSLRESMIRTIDKGKITITKKLPKSESLKDCMDRTIPHFADVIVPDSIERGKRVLISSSENAIRGLLMYLCDIPEERICELEIPNGLPLIYDMKSKCLKLLDDGSGEDPLKKYNFGPAGSFLFKPCQNEDGSPDEECDISFWGASSTGDGKSITTLNISDEDQAILDSIKNPQR